MPEDERRYYCSGAPWRGEFAARKDEELRALRLGVLFDLGFINLDRELTFALKFANIYSYQK